jgi:hypothetical protein
VTTNLDTLLTALYVLIDDHVIPSGQRRAGHPKRLSDGELVCLAAAQVRGRSTLLAPVLGAGFHTPSVPRLLNL